MLTRKLQGLLHEIDLLHQERLKPKPLVTDGGVFSGVAATPQARRAAASRHS
jgi:hypothetical protein